MKKVLIVVTKSNYGGAQRYVFDVASHLPSEEYDIAVVAGEAAPGAGAGTLATRLRERGIRFIFVPELSRDVAIHRDAASLFALIKVFRTERPDVVHLNSAKAAGLGSVAARIACIPRIVTTIHGWAFNEHIPFYSRALRWFFSWLTGIFSHRLIFVARSSMDQARSMPGIARKSILIRNAIPAQEFMSRADARAALIAIDPRLAPFHALRWIGTIAELHPNKGLSYGLTAMRELPDEGSLASHWVIMGDGELRDSLVEDAALSGLDQMVTFMGYVRDAAQYLNAFDVFLLPSLKEESPYVILEAAAAGVPIVATNVGGIRDIAGESAQIIPPHDAHAIAHALLHPRPHAPGTDCSIDTMIDAIASIYSTR